MAANNDTTILLRVGHSPDSDDAFMFYALTHERIDTGNRRYRHILEDIESLNRRAERGELEVSAISIHAFAYVADKYALMSCGCSMGDRYGPLVVARQPLRPADLHEKTIAVPGTMTTAFLTLKLMLRASFAYEVYPFDQILPIVAAGKVDAGLIIHEGQLTYGDLGLHPVVDLGQWWYETTGLPLPLGGNVVRRDLGPELMKAITDDVRRSILYALEHKDEALEYALQYARDLDRARAEDFVSRYVNEWTVDYGPRGREAVQRLLDEAAAAEIIPERIQVEFV